MLFIKFIVITAIISAVFASQHQQQGFTNPNYNEYYQKSGMAQGQTYPIPTSPINLQEAIPNQYSYPSSQGQATNPNDGPYSMQSPPGMPGRYPPQGQYPPNPMNDRFQNPASQQRSVVPFGARGNQPGYGQPQEGGLFSKLKHSLAAAGAAITGADQQNEPSPQYPRGFPPRPPGYSNPYNPTQQKPYPPNPNNPYGRGMGPPPRSPPPAEEGSFFGKIKNLFASDDQQPSSSSSSNPMRSSPPGMYGPPPGYPRPSLSYDASSSSYDGNRMTGADKMSSYPAYTQPSSSSSSSSSSYPPGMGYNDMMPRSRGDNQDNNFSPSQPSPSSSSSSSSSGMNDYEAYMNPSSSSSSSLLSSKNDMMANMMPPEPQAFVVEDCIVFIPKPKEFYRKKALMTAMGPTSLQVFSDFEHIFTKFRSEDGSRALGTAESLENSPALSAAAINKLRIIADDFNARAEMDDVAFEDFTRQCQDIITKEGNLHIANIAPLTRDSVPRMPMRDGWKEVLQGLTTASVPVYIFSSGYGDVAAQMLMQAGISASVDQRVAGASSYQHSSFNQAAAAGLGPMPSNLRIISNFFRTGPDGTVRAFSSPIVHERNKNASTAALHMGMPLPQRPHAIVFGSHEDDVAMTDGLSGLKEQLSIGYLELTEDLPQRITTFLNTFDAVIVGDSSLQYCKTLVEDVLQIPGASKASSKSGKAKSSFFDRAMLGGFSSIDLM